MSLDFQDKQSADLNTLIDVARRLGVTIELDPLLKSIEQAVLKILNCERASVFLYDKGKKELFSKVATGVEEIRFPADKGIAGEAATTRKIINVSDAYRDTRFNPAVDKLTGFKTRNILTLAMDGYDGELMGVMQALNKQEGRFTEKDEQLAETLSALAGVAIQRQRLLEEFAEKQKLERDLDLARQIQKDYLPKANPSLPGFDIAGWNKPADQTGGDAYDFIPCGTDRVGLLIADATGHGVGPALMVAECRALIRALAATSQDLTNIMSIANNVLAGDLQDGRFVTVCLAFLDCGRGEVEFISAGHGPLLHYIAAERKFEEISATTIPMGIMTDIPDYTVSRRVLAPGDLFILLTDGFFEWSNLSGEQFGLRRLYQFIKDNHEIASSQIILQLYETVLRFGEGTPQLDDLTAIFVKRCPLNE